MDVSRPELLSASDEGFKLYKALEPKPDDLYVRKIKFSAMIGDSSNLDRVLRDNGIEILLVAGTKTNVCCESTAICSARSLPLIQALRKSRPRGNSGWMRT